MINRIKYFYKNKKAWLDCLYYELGKQTFDYHLCGLKKVNNDKVVSTKWYKYSQVCFPIDIDDNIDEKLGWVNNREIFPNEIVLDFEEKINLEKIKEEFDKIRINRYMIFDSGSRGYHIHIWFKPSPTNYEKINEIKEVFISLFGADVAKSNTKSMIALEFCKHWKTGKLKKLIDIKWI